MSVELVVVVPVLNGALTIGEQLAALVSQDWDGSWEVVVVDNGSTDRTCEIVKEVQRSHPGRFRLVSAPERQNLSYVRNEGVRRTSSRSIAFCDADDVVAAGWVRGMAEALRTNELVGSRFEYTLLNERSHGRRSTYQTASVGSIFGLPAIGGGGMGCQRSLWNHLRGNDERMLAEDTDFSIRAHLHAGVTPVLADAVYHCRLRQDARGEFRRAMRQAQSEVQIFKRYGSDAFRPTITSAAQRWIDAVLSLRRLRTSDDRLHLARLWGGVIGRMRGSIANGTRYL